MQGYRNIWRWIWAGVAAATVAAVLPAIALAQAAPSKWTATMVAANEVPPTSSTATGTFTATLDEAAGTLTWTLVVPSITNATAAHLHNGVAGANAGIVLPLFAAPTNAPTASINVSGVSKVSDLTGGLAGNFPGFVAALKAGGIYANAHTTANPGGDIRAQVTLVPASGAAPAAVAAPTTATPAKTGNAGLVGTSRSSGFEVVLLVVLTGGLVAAGRASTRGAHR